MTNPRTRYRLLFLSGQRQLSLSFIFLWALALKSRQAAFAFIAINYPSSLGWLDEDWLMVSAPLLFHVPADVGSYFCICNGSQTAVPGSSEPIKQRANSIACEFDWTFRNLSSWRDPCAHLRMARCLFVKYPTKPSRKNRAKFGLNPCLALCTRRSLFVTLFETRTIFGYDALNLLTPLSAYGWYLRGNCIMGKLLSAWSHPLQDWGPHLFFILGSNQNASYCRWWCRLFFVFHLLCQVFYLSGLS